MFHLEMDVLCSELSHLLLLQNTELMLLTLIISSLVKDLSLQKMWSLLIVTLLIKPLMGMISLFLSLKLSVLRKLMVLRRLLLGEVERVQATILPLMPVLSLLLLLMMRRILKLPDTFLDLALYKYLVLMFLLIFS